MKEDDVCENAWDHLVRLAWHMLYRVFPRGRWLPLLPALYVRILAYGVWIVEEAFVLGLGFGWVVVVGIVVGCRVTCCCSSVAVAVAVMAAAVAAVVVMVVGIDIGMVVVVVVVEACCLAFDSD